MSYSSGNWHIHSSKDAFGNTVDDETVLLLRPDGQPANIQKQYEPMYRARGFTPITDFRDLEDVIPARANGPKPKSRAQLRAERDSKS